MAQGGVVGVQWVCSGCAVGVQWVCSGCVVGAAHWRRKATTFMTKSK